MKPTLNEQLARMQKLAGIIKENQGSNTNMLDFSSWKRIMGDDNIYHMVPPNKNADETLDIWVYPAKNKVMIASNDDIMIQTIADKYNSEVYQEMAPSIYQVNLKLTDLATLFPGQDFFLDDMNEGDTDYDRAKSAKRLGKKGEENIYGAGVKKGEEIEKEKMTKSKLKSKIKEMILAELNEDSTEDVDEPGALNNMYDPLAEAEGDMQNLKFNWLIKDEDFYKYYEKGVADGLDVKDGKKVKEIVGYFEDENGDEDFDVIAYISSDGDIVDDDDILYDFWYKELNKKLADLARKGIEDDYEEEDEYEAEDDSSAESLYKMFKKYNLDNDRREYDAEDFMMAYPNLSQEEAEKLEDMLQNPLDEAKKDEEVEDVTVDDTEVVDAPESDMMAGESAEISGIQSNLQAAYAEAKALGDEKLITQIANTITYFTKAHILDTAPINEVINDDSADAIYDILSNMDNEDIINDMFTAMQKNPEMKLEDFLNQYDAGDNPGDDNDDNYDDSMDVYDDSYPDMAEAKKAKGKLDQINENMFPMLKRILR
jgi:hypothetical protein